jgi:hypothetical protein
MINFHSKENIVSNETVKVLDEITERQDDLIRIKKDKKKKKRGRGSNTSTFYKKAQKSSRPETEPKSQSSQESGRANTNVFGTGSSQ